VRLLIVGTVKILLDIVTPPIVLDVVAFDVRITFAFTVPFTSRAYPGSPVVAIPTKFPVVVLIGPILLEVPVGI
jgi:hypothetical protein